MRKRDAQPHANIGGSEITYDRWPQNEDELYEFLVHILGVKLARVSVCPGHDAPFDAFADAFFARSTVAVWKASRGLGGKSMCLATLAWCEMVFLNANVTVLGGSGEQSSNVHNYMTNAWGRPLVPKHLLANDPSKRETKLVHGNTVRALMASQTSVRGPHPERLRLDEVDEMTKEIFDAALGQPISRNGIQSHTVLSSTHQYPDATMTYALKEAKRRKGWKTFHWCFRENLQPNGWLTEEEVERTKSRVSERTWFTEYELQEPSPESRAINTEKIEAMFDPARGNYTGEENQQIIVEPYQRGHVYCTGVDWAKDHDWSIFTTFRVENFNTDDENWILVAWERTGRLPWPVMIEKLRERLSKYPGRCCQDITGVGKMTEDYLEIPEGCIVEGIWLAGKLRTEIFQNYIAAIEAGRFKCPMIEYAFGEHKYATSKDLYTTAGHPPDSFIGGAAAYQARLLALSNGGVSALAERDIINATLARRAQTVPLGAPSRRFVYSSGREDNPRGEERS